MRAFTRSAFLAALAVSLTGALLAYGPLCAPAQAMGSSESRPAAVAVDPNFTAGKAAIDAKNWPGAIAAFQQVVAKDDKNADAFNYLGYAYRNQGNYDEAFKQYNVALTLNPTHKGAHEYVGEAYLKVGNVAKAEEHLARLDKICTFGCAEYTELKAKVAAAKGGKSS